MDVYPSGNIFQELKLVLDKGCFLSSCSLEERWQQVGQPSRDLPPPSPQCVVRAYYVGVRRRTTLLRAASVDCLGIRCHNI